jgi:hypothetical protein
MTYNTWNNFYVIHNFTDKELITIMKNADIGAWLFNEYTEFGVPMNSIIIKTTDGLVHHKYFIYILNKEFEVYELCNEAMSTFEYIIPNKIWVKNTYVRMKDFLDKLHTIYNLDIDKQIIIEE